MMFLALAHFMTTKKDNRWSFFFEPGFTFGQDYRTLTERIKERYTDSLERIGKAPAADCVISAPTSGFGFGVRKLRKSAQDVLRHLDYEGLVKDAGTLYQGRSTQARLPKYSRQLVCKRLSSGLNRLRC